MSLHGAIGYAVAARRLMLALHRAGVEVSWTPMVRGTSLGLQFEPFAGRSMADGDLDRFCNRPLDADAVIVHMRPEYYPWAARAFPGRRVVGHVAWEADRVPRRWPRLMASAERVIVPCSWNREVLRAGGVTVPVVAVPHVCLPSAGPGERPSGPRTVFYTIGTWTARKALPLTIRAYREAFRRGESVLLVVKTTPTAYFESRLARFKRAQRLWGIVRSTFGLPGLRRRPTPAELVGTGAAEDGEDPPVELIVDELDDRGMEARVGSNLPVQPLLAKMAPEATRSARMRIMSIPVRLTAELTGAP